MQIPRPLRPWIRALVGSALAGLVGAALAIGKPPTENHSTLDPAIMQIDEGKYLGQPLDPRTAMVDEQGRAFTLGQLQGKPTILVLSYYGCDGSCPTINQNLAQALKGVSRFRAGQDFHLLTVSFDRQDSAQTSAAFVQQLRQRPAGVPEGWRFAVLQDPAPDAPKRFAEALGFRFFWSRIDKTFLHPNVLVFLTPEGRVARYIYGTSMDARTLELALIDADWGRISESASAVFDMITGACFSYNFSEGRYQPNYALLAGVGALLFGLTAMAIGLLGYRRRFVRRVVHAQ